MYYSNTYLKINVQLGKNCCIMKSKIFLILNILLSNEFLRFSSLLKNIISNFQMCSWKYLHLLYCTIFIFINSKIITKKRINGLSLFAKNYKCTPLDFYANKMLLYYCKGGQKLKSQRPYVGLNFNLYY